MLKNISQEELEELRDSIALITILIAGADGEIESDELSWAEKVTKIRSYANPERFHAFYEEVGKVYHDQVEGLLESLPNDVEKRSMILSNRLEKLNPILAKMENEEGAGMYKGLVSFAEHVAKAAGGFLRFGSISKEEAKWIKLPMLEEIVLEEDTEE